MVSISKVFIPSFVYLLTDERYQTYLMGFLFGHLGHAQGVVRQENKFSEHDHVAYQFKGMIRRPGYNGKFYARIKLVTLGVGSNGHIPLDFFESVEF